MDDLNVFIYDEADNDISWLLSVVHQTDVVIIDVDNCDPVTKQFITFMIAQPYVHYITNDEITPYNLISKNRIWDLDFIVEQIQNQEEEGDADDAE
jgi:hypothetical protein